MALPYKSGVDFVALGLSACLGRSGSHSWLGAGEVVEALLQLHVQRYYRNQSKPHHNILHHTKEAFQHSIGALNYIYNGFRTPRRAKAEEADDNDCAASKWIISC
jgi:hypothetical protein